MKTLTAALLFRFIDRLSQPARAAARAVGSIEQAQKMAARASQQWTRGLEDLDGQMGRLANASLVTEGLDRAGRTLSRPLIAATRQSADFERGMTGIGITAQITDRKLQPLRETILATASELGVLPGLVQNTFSAVLAEGAYRTETELAAAGRAVSRFQKLAEVMRDPLTDAEAGGLTAALGGTMGVSAADLDRSLAMASRSAQQGGVGIGVLGRNMPAQIGALSGLSFANDVGLADLLTANQIAKRLAGSSDQAANNVTNLFAAMASPETIRKFGEAGVNIEREIKRGVENGISPLETLAAVTQRITGGDQFRIGELFGDRQARDAVMALTQNLGDFRTMSAELKDDSVLSAYLADLQRASTGAASDFDRYTASMSRVAIATGSILAPAAGWAARVIERLAGWMSRAQESGNPLARAAVVVAAVLAGAAVAAGAVGNAVIGVIGPWLIMKSVFGTLGGAAVKAGFARITQGIAMARTAAIGFNIAMLANPVVLAVAAAVAAVAIVALVIRKYWQPISAFFVGFGRGLAEAFAPLGAALAPLRPVWDAIVGGVRAVWGWITRLLAPVRMTEQQLAGATSAGQTFGRILGGAVVRLFAPITFLARLAGFVIRNWSGITGGFRQIFDAVGSFFAGLPARFMAFGANIIDGLVNGIRNGVSRVVNAAAEVGRAAASGAASALGIRSPSRVFARLGDFTMQGLSQGLERSQALPLARAAATAALLAAVPFTLAAPTAEAMTAIGRPAASAEAVTARRATAPAVTVSPLTTVLPATDVRRPPADDPPPRDGPAPVEARPYDAGPPRDDATPSDPEPARDPVEIRLIGATPPPGGDLPPGPPHPPAPPAAPMIIRQNLTQYFTVQGANLDVRAVARELKRLGDAGARGALNDGREP